MRILLALLLVLGAEAAFAQTVLPPVKSAGFPQVLCTAQATSANSTNAMNMSGGFRSAVIICQAVTLTATVSVIQSCDGVLWSGVSPAQSQALDASGVSSIAFTIVNPQCDYAIKIASNTGTITCTGWAGTRAP